MDPLTSVLAVSRVDGAVLADVTARGRWGFSAPTMPAAAFHAVTSGSCWLIQEGAEPAQLSAGDVALFPTGAPHAVTSAPDAGVISYQHLLRNHPIDDRGRIDLPGSGTPVRFLCAAYSYDSEVLHPLLSLLPPAVLLRAGDPGYDPAIDSTLALLAHELRSEQAGAPAVVDRLIDILFVHVVRAWLRAAAVGAPPSWLRALNDPATAHVLTLIHQHPERSWTLEQLARSAAVSRATLGRRFVELVGQTPLGYLTAWRVEVAAHLLRSTDQPLAAVARSVGYTSEYAFSRAFSRARAISPGRYRAARRHGTRRDDPIAAANDAQA